MKKILMYEYGDIDVLKEENTEIPSPAAGTLQIKIVSTSVNDPDIAIRKFGPFPTMPKEMRPVLPHMAGEDFAGIVTAVGDGVQHYQVGDHVMGITLSGTTAEYIILPEMSLLYKVPDELELKAVGALGVAVSTAWAAVKNVQLQKGQTVLIHGGAGGVGSYAIQFAKNAGAYVITTAGSYSREYLTELGADEVIDYKTEDFTQKVKDVDAVINLTGQDTLDRSYQVVKNGGFLTSTNGIPDQEKAVSCSINANYTMGMVSPEDMAKVFAMVKEGSLKININKIYPFTLDAVKQAQLDFEQGPNRGKRLIVMEA